MGNTRQFFAVVVDCAPEWDKHLLRSQLGARRPRSMSSAAVVALCHCCIWSDKWAVFLSVICCIRIVRVFVSVKTIKGRLASMSALENIPA